MSAAAPQHMQALARGNEIRFTIARRRKELRGLPAAEAFRLLADQIDSPDEITARSRVGYLLISLPRVGHSKAAKYLVRIGLNAGSFHRRIAHWDQDGPSVELNRPLSERARQALVDLLRAEANRIDRAK